MKEVKVEQDVVEFLKGTNKEIVEQICLNHLALFMLERDLVNKFRGLSIDAYGKE